MATRPRPPNRAMPVSRVTMPVEPAACQAHVQALRANQVASPGSHFAVLLFVTVFLGTFGAVWPLAEASIGACESSRRLVTPSVVISAATFPAVPRPSPLPSTPNGLDWLTHGFPQVVIVHRETLTSRIGLDARRLGDRAPGAAEKAFAVDPPRRLSTPVSIIHPLHSGVSDVQALSERGPPAAARPTVLAIPTTRPAADTLVPEPPAQRPGLLTPSLTLTGNCDCGRESARPFAEHAGGGIRDVVF